jgi:hypothetical protein
VQIEIDPGQRLTSAVSTLNTAHFESRRLNGATLGSAVSIT